MKKILGILILTVICISSLMADLNDGLVAYYPFNGNANDESGNGNNGTVYGATLTTDRFGNADSAYDFDGNDYINCGNSSSLNWQNSNFSVSVWYKRAEQGIQYSSHQVFIGKQHSSYPNYRGWYLRNNPDNFIEFNMNYDAYPWIGNGIVHSTYDVVNTNWHHIVCVFDSQNSFVKLYIDGVLNNIETETNAYNIDNISDLFIGKKYNGEYFFGKVDDIRIYNRALSESQIQELYHQGDWPFLAKFTANPRFGSYPLEVSFTDLSNNSTSWEWDFQNDGIIDSYVQNPDFTFNQSGMYDVKLKATFGTIVDSLLKTNYIVVQESQLAAPQNPIITINENNVVLNWDAVLNADYYLIYKSDDPYNDFEYLDYTTAVTSYTHSNVISQEHKQFYIIIGFDGTMERLAEFIEVNQRKSFKTDFLNK